MCTANLSTSQTSYVWQAGSLPEANLSGEIVFFRLVNNDDQTETTDSGDVQLIGVSDRETSSAE